MQLLMISRHAPTAAQIKTAQKMGFTGIQQIELDVTAENFLKALRVNPQLEVGLQDFPRGADGRPQTWMRAAVALVAPLPVALRVLTAGWNIIHWEGTSSARVRGAFVCSGARRLWLAVDGEGDTPYLYQGDEFYPCPVPAEEQEDSSLAPTPRT